MVSDVVGVVVVGDIVDGVAGFEVVGGVAGFALESELVEELGDDAVLCLGWSARLRARWWDVVTVGVGWVLEWGGWSGGTVGDVVGVDVGNKVCCVMRVGTRNVVEV